VQNNFCQHFIKFPPTLMILANRWQRGKNNVKFTQFPPHLICVNALPC